jgi:tRNA dimethylallyltransferase
VGPTASGKSALGVFLAQKLGGEIISADSRQIYKGMEVTSRAPNKRELRATPHHLVSFLNPAKKFSAGEYKKKATKVCSSILQNNKIPIVVGGTGFYTDTLLRGLTLPEVAPNKKLRVALLKKTPAQLLKMLQKLDPKSVGRVDPKNIVRLIRAIEIAKAIGPIPLLTHETPYQTLWLGLMPDPKKHQVQIKKGVESRLKAGMVPEANKLRTALTKKRYLELGFEFSLLADYLDKKISKKELAELLIRGEERYAKRQMRWFKRNKDMVWVATKSEALRLAKEFLY